VTWTTVFQSCRIRRSWIVPQLRRTVSRRLARRSDCADQLRGDSRRCRTSPLDYQSHPICNVACNPLISLPLANIQCPCTQDPCHTRGGCGRLIGRRRWQTRRTPGIRAMDPSAPRHISAPISWRRPRLRCGRVSPIRFSLTGATPGSRAPRGQALAPRQPTARRLKMSKIT
jgi:hypothetical protein